MGTTGRTKRGLREGVTRPVSSSYKLEVLYVTSVGGLERQGVVCVVCVCVKSRGGNIIMHDKIINSLMEGYPGTVSYIYMIYIYNIISAIIPYCTESTVPGTYVRTHEQFSLQYTTYIILIKHTQWTVDGGVLYRRR